MKHRVWLDEANGVLWIRLVGFCDRGDLHAVSNKCKEMLSDRNSGKGVIDLSAINCFPDEEDREQLVNGTLAAGLKKVAVIGSKPQVRVVARAILDLLGSHAQTNFFQDEQNALSWLLED